MLTNNQNLLDSMDVATISMAASFNMVPVYVFNQVVASIQLVFTGTPAGSFKLQASNDVKTTTDFLPTNWTDISGSTNAVAAAGSLLYNVNDIGYAWLRVVYTASGAGTSPVLTSARIVIKGV